MAARSGSIVGRWVIALIAVASIAGVFFLWADGWAVAMMRAVRVQPERLAGYIAVLLESLAAVIAAGVALAIALRAWHTPVARALAIFLAGLALSLSGLGIGRFLGRIGARAPMLESLVSAVALGVAFGALVHFSALLQPSTGTHAAGGWRVRLRRWSEHAPTIWGATVVVAALMAAELLLNIHTRPSLTEALLVLAIAVAFSNLALGHRDADAASRRAIWWVFAGALFALIGTVLRAALAILGHTLGPWADMARYYVGVLGLIAFLVCLAMAIFQRGVLDPRLVVRRTALTAGVASVLVFAFAVGQNALSDLLAARLGADQGVGGWIAGALIAVGAAPLWRATRRVLGRLLPPEDPPPVAAPGEAPAATSGSPAT